MSRGATQGLLATGTHRSRHVHASYGETLRNTGARAFLCMHSSLVAPVTLRDFLLASTYGYKI